MIIMTVAVDVPMGQAIGVKEELAMHLGQWGRTSAVNVARQERGVDITFEIDAPEIALPAIRADTAAHLRYWGDSRISAISAADRQTGGDQITLYNK